MRNQQADLVAPENGSESSDVAMETGGACVRPIPRIRIEAFCESQSTANVIQVASEDRRLAKAHVAVQMGGVQAAVAYYQNTSSPNLIVLESGKTREQILNELNQLAEVCDSGTKVIVIGHVNDVLLYRELMSLGVSEYLVTPLSPLIFMEGVSNLYSDSRTNPVGDVIAFVGAKGGSGSSTICHNVAWTISELIRADVVVADFDLPFGTAGLDFNKDPIQGIADALGSPDRLDDVMLDRLLSKCSEHLSLFAAPGSLDKVYDLTPEACDVVMDVARQNIPYIAVDLPHMWTSWARKILFEADNIVITAVPDLANLRNAKNIVDLLKANRTNDNPPFLILNQIGVPKRPEIEISDFSNAVELSPHAVIEFDADLFGTAANNGQMIEEVDHRSNIVPQLHDIAYLITGKGREVKAVQKPSLLSPILSRITSKKAGA